jgi:hypothetical protein
VGRTDLFFSRSLKYWKTSKFDRRPALASTLRGDGGTGERERVSTANTAHEEHLQFHDLRTASKAAGRAVKRTHISMAAEKGAREEVRDRTEGGCKRSEVRSTRRRKENEVKWINASFFMRPNQINLAV